MKSLSPVEIVKYNYRRELFAQKINEQTDFELVDGSLVRVQGYTHDILTATQVELRAARFLDHNFQWHKLSDFAKTSEFGGKGNGLKREDDALKSLNKQIEDLKAEWQVSFIPIRVGSKVHKIQFAMSTPGTVKSDFELVNESNESVIWISHKHGTKPTHFQQWGGVSDQAGLAIANHSEVLDFAASIKKKFPNGLPAKTTLWRPICSGNLKCRSVYGPDAFNLDLGRDNVSLVLQGDVKLVWNWVTEDFSIQGTTHTHVNGEEIGGDYEPALYAVYKTDRSDKGIVNARITINPTSSRNKRTLI